MELVPYLYFKGNAEQAVNFYAKIFDGTSKIQRFKDVKMEYPKGYEDKILHCVIEIEKNRLMISDVFPDKTINKDGSINLSLDINSFDKTKDLFHKLSDGGSVSQPLEKTFWGAYFGMLTDKFGVKWMLNCEE